MTTTETLYRQDAYLTEMSATVIGHSDGGIILDRTVFYAAGGGQPGDIGVILPSGGDAQQGLRVTGTIPGADTSGIIHKLSEDSQLPEIGATVLGRIDWHQRIRHMRVHSAMHLLCSIVDGGVTGGQIGADRGRLDFDLETAPDKSELTARLNALITADHPITSEWITGAELDANPSMVRTLSAKPPRSGDNRIRVVVIGNRENPVDRQPCGGTHVRSTAEIGPVTVSKIENKGRQNRRIVITLNGD